ncbi:MAG: hypothetical protein ACK5O3_03010 [Burkholderiales bacterium]
MSLIFVVCASIGWLIARGKGFLAVVILFVAGFVALAIWGGLESRKSKQEQAAERAAIQSACYEKALRDVPAQPVAATRIVIRHQAAGIEWLDREMTRERLEALPLLELVPEFPLERSPDSLYVDLKLFRVAIEGAGANGLLGASAEVTDAKGRQVARINDYYLHGRYWCLGDQWPQTLEKFLSEVSGADINVSKEVRKAFAQVPAYSPRAQVLSDETGSFPIEFSRKNAAGSWLPSRVLSMQDAGACKLRTTTEKDIWVCQAGTPDETLVYSGAPWTHWRGDGVWLSGASDYRDRFGATQWILERRTDGVVQAVWNLRLPPGSLDSWSVAGMVLKGRRLELTLHSQQQLCPPRQIPPDSVLAHCAARRTVLAANLVPPR